MDPLHQELLELICTICNIPPEQAAEMRADTPLIGPESPLGTDSIDALEIAVTVQQTYGVRMDAEHAGREVMASLASLADHIRANR